MQLHACLLISSSTAEAMKSDCLLQRMSRYTFLRMGSPAMHGAQSLLRDSLACAMYFLEFTKNARYTWESVKGVCPLTYTLHGICPLPPPLVVEW